MKQRSSIASARDHHSICSKAAWSVLRSGTLWDWVLRALTWRLASATQMMSVHNCHVHTLARARRSFVPKLGITPWIRRTVGSGPARPGPVLSCLHFLG